MKQIFLLLIMLIVTACNPDSELVGGFDFPSDCCTNTQWEMEFLTEEVEIETQIYSPNVFNPNGDGFCDIYLVQSAESLTTIELFEIKDLDGLIVHREENFPPNDETFGWDGTVVTNQIDGGYEVKVIYSPQEGTRIQLSHFICAIDCHPQNAYSSKIDFTNALWPSQHNGNGKPDLTLAVPICP